MPQDTRPNNWLTRLITRMLPAPHAVGHYVNVDTSDGPRDGIVLKVIGTQYHVAVSDGDGKFYASSVLVAADKIRPTKPLPPPKAADVVPHRDALAFVREREDREAAAMTHDFRVKVGGANGVNHSAQCMARCKRPQGGGYDFRRCHHSPTPGCPGCKAL